MGGELVVDVADGIELALNLFLVEGVEEDLDVSLSVEGHAGGLADDAGGVALLNSKVSFPLDLTSIMKSLRNANQF